MVNRLLGSKPLRKFALIFAVWTALGLLWAVNAYHLRIAIGARAPMQWMLQRSLGEHWVWAALTPVVFWFAAKFPFSRGQIARTLLIHACFFVSLSMAHVTLSEALHIPMAYGSKGLPSTTWWIRFNLEFYGDLWNFVPLVCIQNLVDYYRKYRERELRASQLETKLTRAQLEVLRAQLQPHFLFNTLNSISSLMHDDVNAADDMLADLSYMLRASLNSSDKQQIPLRQELELLEAYLRIQHKRFEDRLRTRVDVDPETLDALVPTLLLQPLVENAIQHGIAPLARPGTVEVLTSLQDGRLVLQVIDDGRGLAANYRERIGLGNTRQRLAQLFGDEQSLKLSNRPERGVMLTIIMPLQPAATDANEEGSDDNSNAGSGRRASGASSRSVLVEG